ncbi:MAG: hypothetical protein QE487_07640 [Fluviicola sp.]|nr:hypothetical protein [Fluviicola sp.]
MALARTKTKSDSLKKNDKSMTKLEQIQVLMNAFKMERIVYIILTTISAISLILTSLFFVDTEKRMETLLIILAPTGALTMCVFRILKMWDDALKFITESNTGDDEQ